jgi:tyrosyl-tRNA synthetase
VTEKELLELLRKKANPIAYDGFEPSGRMHIAQVSLGEALLTFVSDKLRKCKAPGAIGWVKTM